MLGVHQSAVSALERGAIEPSLHQICELSLIFGRSFESLFAAIMADKRQKIARRLAQLPALARSYVGTFNRASSIRKLEARLAAYDYDHGAE